MSTLPINNLEEQLARFSAAKKSIVSNTKPSTNKKFTFKRSLSLGKSNDILNHNSGVASTSNETKTFQTSEKPLVSNIHQRFESSSEPKFTFKSNEQNNVTRSGQIQKKIAPDIRKYFSSNESNEIQDDIDFIDEISEVYNSNPAQTSKPVSDSLTESKENIFPKSTVYKGKEKHSNEQSSVNTVSRAPEYIPRPAYDSNFHSNDENHADNTSPTSFTENNSLKELNFKIMTKICNILESQQDILLKNKDLNHLITLRKKILHRQSTNEFKSQLSKPSLNTSNCNDISEIILDDDKDTDFHISKNLKKMNSFPLFNSSVSAGKSNPKLNSFTPTGTSFITADSLSSQPCKLKTSLFSSTKSQSSFQTNSTSLSKGNSFPSNGILKDNSFEKKFDCKSDEFNDNIEIFNEKDIENIEASFSELENEPGTSYEIKKSFSFKDKDNKEKIIAGKFCGNQRDDGASPQYKGLQFPFSADVMLTFQNVFGLKKFRHNQLETINASLLGEDCFVLMPTGGGKSLCYQLPALVSSGVTIVISPLRSLIMDQVQKLCSLDIPASSLTGDADTSTVNYVYSQLASREPSIKLLYVTPEKISASAKLISCIEGLYSRKMIQRFVIDEAHCVSQWGHDFRPDYKRLKVLREKFPKAPLMALTATATPRVRGDILHQLGMKSPKWFLQSFNRPNLKYEVRPKTKGVVADIIELLESKFRNMCGIIYCLSRNDCDTVADILMSNGIKAASYHAGLNNRDEVQEQWINDKFKVICATIAFGMGIDKPDVRFVIHHSIPKSIEGYYQESGRAGRDGEQSWCILYYSYKDMQRIKRMITKDAANKHSWSTHFDNLYKMVHYCENRTDCRRVWMLGYFGEIFEKSLCLNSPETSCDNCYSKEVFEQCDVTEDAKSIVQCVAKLVNKQKRKNYTLTYFVDIYKGAKIQKLLAAGHNKLELYGKGHSLHRSDAERLLRKLVLDQYLQEDMVINKMDLPITYIYLGKRAKDLLSGKAKVVLSFRKGKDKLPHTSVASTDDKEMQELIERCYNELIEVSKAIALERNMHYTNVINVEALRQMSREMPMCEEDMLTIPHVTHAVYEKYGKRFLEVTAKYAAERCVIDAERADEAILTACAEDIDDWSDNDCASTSKASAKRGVKRKASKSTAGKTAKKQKNYFVKKYQKGKAKGGYSTYASKKKNQMSQNKVTTKVPGFMPNPKAFGKTGARSFLPAPRIVLS